MCGGVSYGASRRMPAVVVVVASMCLLGGAGRPGVAVGPVGERRVAVVTGRPAGVVVLTALAEERAAVLAAVGSSELRVDSSQELRLADVGGVRVVILPPVGMGNAQAAAEVGRAVQAWRPEYVVLVGIAGGLHPDVRLGDILVADQVVGYEQARIGAAGPEWRYEVYRPAHRLLDSARVVAAWWRARPGPTRSGACRRSPARVPTGPPCTSGPS
jgi:adenosylhomocysteine nucleosidase